MRVAGSLAAVLVMTLSIVPAGALSEKDRRDCEQMTNPGLKVAACTRILNAGNLTKELEALGHHHRGVGLLLQDNFDRAIVEFNEALRADPAYKRSYNSRGNAWKGKGELDQAIADYNEAIRLDPSFSFPYNGRAAAYYDKGELDRAIADYNEVIRLDPSLAAPGGAVGTRSVGRGLGEVKVSGATLVCMRPSTDRPRSTARATTVPSRSPSCSASRYPMSRSTSCSVSCVTT
jgi:tetratricopeptide (TPR) repeat protein